MRKQWDRDNSQKGTRKKTCIYIHALRETFPKLCPRHFLPRTARPVDSTFTTEIAIHEPNHVECLKTTPPVINLNRASYARDIPLNSPTAPSLNCHTWIFSVDPQPVTIRDNDNYNRGLFFSYYTTFTGCGVLLMDITYGLCAAHALGLMSSKSGLGCKRALQETR